MFRFNRTDALSKISDFREDYVGRKPKFDLMHLKMRKKEEKAEYTQPGCMVFNIHVQQMIAASDYTSQEGELEDFQHGGTF